MLRTNLSKTGATAVESIHETGFRVGGTMTKAAACGQMARWQAKESQFDGARDSICFDHSMFTPVAVWHTACSISFTRLATQITWKGGEKIMKRIGTMVSMMVMAGSLAGSVFAADNVIMKEQAGDNYCHIKFPAITQSTLFTNHPTPKSLTTADIIDYYGSCDESATSKDEIAAQRRDALHSWGE